MRRRQLVLLSPIFEVKKQTYPMHHIKKMKLLNLPVHNCKPFWNWLNCYREIMTRTWPNMICCWPEGDCDVVSGRNVKTIMGEVVVNFKAASSSSFWYKKIVLRRWWRRQTSTIALSENAFAFRLKSTCHDLKYHENANNVLGGTLT